MAMVSTVLGMYIGPHQVAALYTDDLVDYYYEYFTELARTRRNVLAGSWSAHHFMSFNCWRKSLCTATRIKVCFSTLALGDTNADEFG